MPNRILRDWTDSESIDQLDVHAERFFTRLIMKVDDYGRYTANVKLLKSNLFPLRTDIRETDIPRWLTACEKSGLIALYKVASKDYLQINNFKQVLRQKIEKYPSPSECNTDATQMTSECNTIASLKRNESETNPEVEGPKAAPAPISSFSIEQKESFIKFQTWIKENTPRVGEMKEPFTIDQYFKLIKNGYNSENIRKLLAAMHNWKPLLTKNLSAYLTLIRWNEKTI
jgi:hypothetical protein